MLKLTRLMMVVMLAGLPLCAHDEFVSFTQEEQELLNEVWHSKSHMYIPLQKFACDCGEGYRGYNPKERPLCKSSLEAMRELAKIIKEYGAQFDKSLGRLSYDREQGYQKNLQQKDDTVTVVEGLNSREDWHRVYTTFETEGDAASKLYVLSRHESECKNGTRRDKTELQKLSRYQLLLLKKRYADYQVNGFLDESCQVTNKLVEDVSKIVPVYVLLKQFEKDLDQ